MTEYLILSGFESHIRSKNSNFIFFSRYTGELFKTVNGQIRFGKAKVFITVIFHIKNDHVV